MITTYHVHSVRSDGKSSIYELAQSAADAGIDELGISDHYVLLPSGEKTSWSMSTSDLPGYFEEIRQVAQEFQGRLTIRYGLEADFIPQSASTLADLLHTFPLDYVIGSIHFIDGFPVDESADVWDALTEPEQNERIRAYWDRIAQMARSKLFDFVGHIDLYKKFGHRSTGKLSSQISEALDAVAEAEMAVEINTSGWYTPGGEVYPSPDILRECHKRGIPILINSDAHTPENLTRGFANARKLAREVGYDHTVAYQGRQSKYIKLP